MVVVDIVKAEAIVEDMEEILVAGPMVEVADMVMAGRIAEVVMEVHPDTETVMEVHPDTETATEEILEVGQAVTVDTAMAGPMVEVADMVVVVNKHNTSLLIHKAATASGKVAIFFLIEKALNQQLPYR